MRSALDYSEFSVTHPIRLPGWFIVPDARLLPSLDVVAISQAPSPESNPNSPLPVIAMVVQYTTIESMIGQKLE